MASMHDTAGGVKPARTRKPERFVQWLSHEAPGTGILQIRLVYSRTREEADVYLVRPLDSDFCAGYSLQRLDMTRLDDGPYDSVQLGDCYQVALPGPEFPGSCDCLGHSGHGHCKHVDALSMLQSKGRL